MTGFKRARSSSSASSNSVRRTKRSQSSGKRILPGVKIYIVQAKLAPPTIAKLFKLVENHAGKLCKGVEEADVVITAISMRKRLERHVPPDMIRMKRILTPEWLEDSVKHGQPMPYSAYPALNTDPELSAVESDSSMTTRPASPATLDHTATLSCQRASPLVCINQDLVTEINIIRRSRELECNFRSALSYSRAIAAIKSCPYKIRTPTQASKLPYIGVKITSKIEEYLDTGHIAEAQSILADRKYHVLDEFASIYGIGPTTAQTLYNKGARTLEDLVKYYKVPPDLKTTTQQTREEAVTPENWVEVSLALKDDLSIKIPKKEVEKICERVAQELDEIQVDCSYTIVGGYRRGKLESNDVDVVFTHPDPKKIQGLCRKLTERLCRKGLVTHLMSMTGFDRTRSSHVDLVEKALTIFSLPGSGPSRRLDLIFAHPEVYWTTVVGWTGSTQFERDLRLHAKSKNLKFDSSGITYRKSDKRIVANSEQDVFKILGLDWIDPTLRNADA